MLQRCTEVIGRDVNAEKPRPGHVPAFLQLFRTCSHAPAPSDPLFPRSRTRKTRFFDTRPTRTSETDTSTQYTVFTSTLGHRTQGWHSPGMNVEDVPKSGKSSDPETRTRITRKTRKCGYTYQELAHTSEVTRFTPGFVR